MGNRRALLISVGRFSTGPGTRELDRLLADPAVGDYETLLVDGTSQELRIAIDRFFSSAARDDFQVLYLSSHGLIDDSGRLYFGAQDTELDLLAATSVSADFVRDAIASSRCRSIVAILDCSYSGAFPHDLGGVGRVVITSSGAHEAAYARVFTDALIDGLRTGDADLDGDGTIDADELFTYLHRAVREAHGDDGSRQTPTRFATTTGKLVFAYASQSQTQTILSSPVITATAHVVAQVAVEPAAEEPETKVDWATDKPSDKDHLNREPLAKVLASQIREVRRKDPGTSFLIHLDGPWGAGKSTLLNLLEKKLGGEFTVVRFDAWRQSRLGPPWWALLSATRRTVADERNPFAAIWLRVRETFVRARRAGAAFTLAVILLVLLLGGLAAVVLPHVPGSEAVAVLAKSVTSVLAAVAALWAGARVAAKLLLWDSARGARLFEQSTANPMDQVAAHFDWLLNQSRKPVLFFVDDLDRCPGTYVVDLLDAVQTLIRDAPSGTNAAYFVVAADGAWLRKSYEDAFPSFHDCVSAPGYSLGHLFLDKLFQLAVPVPAASAQARAGYLERLLHIADPVQAAETEREVEDGKAAIARVDDEAAILQIVESASDSARDELAGEAALALVSPQTRARTEHTLSKFLPLLHSNPRNIKKFLNTYNVLRSVRTLELNTVPSDVLALWTILRVRWPSMADHLEADPEAIRGIAEPLWASECLPSELRELAHDPGLRAVVLHPGGGPLTADLVRLCTGN